MNSKQALMDELVPKITPLIDECLSYLQDGGLHRQRAIEYYNYELKDLPVEKNRSSAVSNDLRAIVKNILPSTVRTFFKNANFVKYEPTAPEYEEDADNASLYINKVIMPQCDAEVAIYDAISDAILLRTGILKWEVVEKTHISKYTYRNITEQAVMNIINQDGVTVSNVSQTTNAQGEILFTFNAKVEKVKTEVKLKAIPRGSFLFYPNCEKIEDSPIVGDMELLTRSELVARGYDARVVYDELVYDSIIDNSNDNDNEARTKDFFSIKTSENLKENETILIYNIYAKIDIDNDGIAEIYKLCVASNSGAYRILDINEHYEYPYSSIVIEREAHKFEGRSIAEDVMQIQKINTSLIRQALNNVYWSNSPQRVIDRRSIDGEALEKILNPRFGETIFVNGIDKMDAVRFLEVPFVADKALEIRRVMQDELNGRTGINDKAGGLNPDNLANMSQIAIEALNAPALAQTEMMIRNISKGLQEAFSGLLKLVIQNTDKPITAKISESWQVFDPRVWESEMRCTVNVGYGSGGQKEDMQAVTMILQYQKMLIEAFGADNNPFVKASNIYNALEALITSSGVSNVGNFFTKPNDDEIQQQITEKQQSSNPEQMKMEVQKELAMHKTNAQLQIEEAQRQADRDVEQAKFEKDYLLQQQKLEFDKQAKEMELALELRKHQDDMAIKQGQIEQQVYENKVNELDNQRFRF